MSSKTDVSKRADAKKKERFYAKGKQVTPVKVGKRMVWQAEDGERFEKWETRS